MSHSTREQLMVLGRGGSFEALSALLDAQSGLTYSDLHFGALCRRNTTNIMRALVDEGLAVKRGNRFVLTDAGRVAVSSARVIVALKRADREGFGLEMGA